MTLSTRAASQLLVLLTAAASANARAATYLATGCGECGHGYASHDVDRRGVRTRCSVADGDGACACRRWEPITTDEAGTFLATAAPGAAAPPRTPRAGGSGVDP